MSGIYLYASERAWFDAMREEVFTIYPATGDVMLEGSTEVLFVKLTRIDGTSLSEPFPHPLEDHDPRAFALAMVERATGASEAVLRAGP